MIPDWFRVDCDIRGNPKVGEFADRLDVETPTAIGYLVCVFASVRQHRPLDGSLVGVSDRTLEEWALWRGARGVFATAFREFFAEGDQPAVSGWTERQAPLIRRVLAERNRAKLNREKAKQTQGAPTDPPPSGGESADSTRTNSRTVLRQQEQIQRKNKNTRAVADATSCEPDPDGFADAWRLYPRRVGGNSRKDALAQYRARLREGVSPTELLDGLRRYAAFCDATGLTGGRYVMQATRFFGASGLFAEPWDLPSDVPARGAPVAVRAPAALDVLAPAALRARFAQHDLWHFVDNESYRAKIDRARPDGIDAEAWVALVKAVRPWDLGHLSFGPEIEQRIAAGVAAWRTPALAVAC